MASMNLLMIWVQSGLPTVLAGSHTYYGQPVPYAFLPTVRFRVLEGIHHVILPSEI